MHPNAAGALRPLHGLGRAVFILLALLALLATTSIGGLRVRAATTAASQLKAVLIVGPSGDSSINKQRAEAVALQLQSYGVDVRRVFHPHATWARVLDNVQNANLMIYWGHGNGWPSPYGPFQEKTKNGMGLNSFDGSSTSQLTYYGGNYIRNNITLAPNAIVGLNHLCYASGNGEPGMSIPTWDVARQRVDNYAAAFLYAGAKAVFALATGEFKSTIDMLMNTNKTVDEIFSTPGSTGTAYSGFVGWNDKYFDSGRMPGFKNHLDPESSAGFRRALSGRMDMTADEWKRGAADSGSTAPKPTVGAPSAAFVEGARSRSTTTLRLSWDASPSPDVVSYDLQYSKNAGAWTAVTLGSPTALSADVALAAGNLYAFRLRATDVAGTVGDWVTTPVRKLARAQETATTLAYSGTWSGKVYLSGASGNYVKKGDAAGSSVSWSFSGTDVGFVTTKAPGRGMAEVWLDGAKVATLDLFAATKEAAKVAWAAEVSAGTHVVEIRTLGTKNVQATATRVDVDAFVVWK